MANEVIVELTVEERQALRSINKIVKKFNKDIPQSVKKTDVAVGSFIGSTLGGLATRAIAGLSSQMIQFGKDSLEAAKSLENLSVGFEVLTGSAKTAGALMEELKEFSAGTPFQLQGIAESAQQLIAFGFEANTVTERLRKIGDVAAGSNSQMKEVALIYGQVAAAGKLTGERLLQLQERAIPIGSAIAKSMGVAESQVRNLVSTGKVGFEEFEKAFNSMSESGGLFEGAIEKQSQTLSGSLSTLKDNFFLLKAEIGKAFAPSVVAGAKALTAAMGGLVEVMKDKTPEERIVARIEHLKKEKEMTRSSLTLAHAMIDKNIAIRERELAGIRALNAEKQTETDIEERKKALRGGGGGSGAVEAQIKENEQLKALKEMAWVEDQERELLVREARNEQREGDLEELNSYELAKIQIERDAALEAESDKQKRAIISAKFNKKIHDAELKQQVAAEKAITNVKKMEANARNNIISNSFALASALMKDGSKEQFIIGKLAALANIAIADGQARAQAFAATAMIPYPANLAAFANMQGLITANTALSTGIVAATAIKGFQDGGILGGNSPTGDKVLFRGNSGELIMNENQQDVDAGRIQGIENLTNAINNQAIILNVDGREIARAVRNEVDSGFDLGVA